MKLRSTRLLILPLICSSLLSFKPLHAAHWDQSLGVLARVVPFGMAGVAELGWNSLLWGERGGPGSFRYGYLRLAARYAGSGFANRGDLTATVSPMAPLAVDLGLTARLRLIREFATVDCTGLQCQGLLYGSFVRARTLVGFGSAFLLGVATLEHLSPQITTEGASPVFVDEQSALRGGDPTGRLKGDFRQETFLLAGVSVKPGWSTGWMHQQSRMIRLDQSNQLDVLFVRHDLQGSWKNWHLTAGAGLYRSSTYPTGPSAVVRWEWNDDQSLELR